MASFAGYEMPIQYPTGVIEEHNWVREHAGIFDVSHMGQYILSGEESAAFLSYITPSPFLKTAIGKCKYTVLTNENGGIIDDLIVTRLGENEFYLVLNAACVEKDVQWLKKHLPATCNLEKLNRSLIAIQGPEAEEVIHKFSYDHLDEIPFMGHAEITFRGMKIGISRSGYTGEDGFEISAEHEDAKTIWQILLQETNVKPIGLAARDSLRLEAGLPLYGHDLDETTSPIEGSIAWVVAKKNAEFMGAERILAELEEGASRYRIGIELTDKGIAREGSKLLNTEGEEIGVLTSGTFSPTLKKAIGMGYIQAGYQDPETEIFVEVRGKRISALTHSPTFIKSNTKSLKRK